jgi:NTE family protein
MVVARSGTDACDAISLKADSVLLLAEEEGRQEGWQGPAVSPDARTGVIVASASNRLPTVGDLKRARPATDPRWPPLSMIAGGLRDPGSARSIDLATSETIDRAARAIAGLSVGLALGGGGAKGYAHIGVVTALQRAGVPFDCVSGCSIGAPLAAGVAAGWDISVIRETLDTVSRKAVRPNVPLISILTSRSVRRELRLVTEDGCFDDVAVPLSIVAVDIERREEVVLRRGPVWLAMAASMAYPGIYEPIRIGSRLLVDGGVLNPVPVSAAVALGANVVVSSNLSANHDQVVPQKNVRQRRRHIVENIARSLEIMQSKIVAESCNRADVSIEPRFNPAPGLLDFKRGRTLERAGEEAAEEALPRIREVLPWLS